MLMPEVGEALDEVYVVSEVTARRILQDMARKSLRLRVTDAAGAHGRDAIVYGQLANDTERLLLKQSGDDPASLPLWQAGDAIRLRWSYRGARHWAEGRVLRVDAPERVYEVDLEGQMYRSEQRASPRVSIGADHPIAAQLYVETAGELLDATVKNLSMSGCRLAVDARRLRYTEPEPHHRAFINLTLPPSEQIISNEVRIVWAARVAATTMHISVAWVAPIEKFSADVKRYLADKTSGT